MSESPDHPDPEDFHDPLQNYDPPVYADAIQKALAESPVTRLKLTPYSSVTPDTPVRRAVQALAGLKVSCLLITENDVLIGIFTERDVLERVSDRYAEVKDTPVRELMTGNPTVLRETETVGDALGAIAASGYRHVPVVDENRKILGIVSPRRVFAYVDSLVGDPA